MEDTTSLQGKSTLEKEILFAEWVKEIIEQKSLEQAISIVKSIYSTGFRDGCKRAEFEAKHPW